MKKLQLTCLTPLIWIIFFTISFHTINAQVAKDTILASQYFKKADSLLKDRKFDKSIIFFKKALPIYEKAKTWEKVASCYNKLSENQWRNHRLDKSLQNSKKALEISRNYLEQRSKHEANAYYNIGTYYRITSDYKKAIEYQQKALSIRKHLFSEYHIDIIASYNSIAIVYCQTYELKKATKYFEKALEGSIEISGSEHLRTGRIYNNLSNLNKNLGNLEKALDYAQISLDIKIKTLGGNNAQVGTAYLNLGTIYGSLFLNDDALDSFLKAISIFEENEESSSLCKAYLNIGILLLHKKEYDRALGYIKKSHRIGVGLYGENHYLIAFNNMNIGVCYDQKNENEKAIEYYKRGLDILNVIYSKENINHGKVYTNIGRIHEKKKEYHKAEKYYNKALVVYNSISEVNHLGIGQVHNNLSELYLLKKEYDKALINAKKGLHTINKQYESDHFFTSKSYTKIGRVYGKQKEYAHAILYFDKALLANKKKNQTKQVDKNFDPNDYSDWMILLETLYEKSKALRGMYYEKKDTKYPEKSQIAYKKIDVLIDNMRKSYQNHQDKLNFAKLAKEIYTDAIKTQLVSYKDTNDVQELEQAFYYVGKSKANTLKELLTDTKVKNFLGLPDKLLILEKTLKSNHSFYQSQIIEEESKDSVDISKIKEYENDLFTVNRRQDSLTTILEKNYPKYHQLKYQNDIISVTKIQEQLDDSTTMLEFFTSDSITYAFTISKNELAVKELSTPKLTEQIETFRKSIIDKDIQANKKIGHDLYTKLIAPIADKLVGEELIIIPDGSLWHLNFDVLLTQDDTANNPSDLSYLLKDYAITYANSANLLFNSFKSEQEAKSLQECLAFSFSDSTQTSETSTMSLATLRDAGDDLPGTRKEIKAISDIIDGEYYYGAQAIEANFKKQAGQYNILHLALHGEMDNEHPENSKLYFTKSNDTIEDNLLYGHELFALDIPAELTVLSACNTGSGKIAKGEGIMSLGTAFQYAGTKSLLLTNWEVSDQTTPELMKYFYTNLKEGMSKGKALQQAKLQYLNTADVHRTAPFYWAGFYLVGDSAPMHFGTNTWMYWAIGLGILGILTLLGLWYRKRNQEA